MTTKDYARLPQCEFCKRGNSYEECERCKRLHDEEFLEVMADD